MFKNGLKLENKWKSGVRKNSRSHIPSVMEFVGRSWGRPFKSFPVLLDACNSKPCTCVCLQYISLLHGFIYVVVFCLFFHHSINHCFSSYSSYSGIHNNTVTTTLLCGWQSVGVESIALCGGWCKKIVNDSRRVGVSTKSEQRLCFRTGKQAILATHLTGVSNRSRNKQVICLREISDSI